MEFTKKIGSRIGMGPAFPPYAAAVSPPCQHDGGLSASQTPMAELGW